MNNLTKKEMIEEISESTNCPLYILECLNKLTKNDLEGIHYHLVLHPR